MTSRGVGDTKNLRTFFRYLEQQYISLRAVGASERILGHYAELLAYLKSRSDEERAAIFPSSAEEQKERVHQSQLSETDDVIRQWQIEKVEEFLAIEASERKDLERVAKLRFGMTRGALSSLKNKDALRQKLQTLARNERGHESIRRLAQAGVIQSKDNE